MNKKMSVSRALSGKRYENVRTNLDTFDTVKTRRRRRRPNTRSPFSIHHYDSKDVR